MGLYSEFKREDPMSAGPPEWPLDVGSFRIGPHALGAAPDTGDLWGRLMHGDVVCQPQESGVEIGLSGGVVDHAFLDLSEFRAGFRRHGEILGIGPATTEAEIVRLFGEPYWTDRSDGEVILFYEFQGGEVELQFEFPQGDGLGFVTLTRNGVMSDAGQRAAYGCDRPWPPL